MKAFKRLFPATILLGAVTALAQPDPTTTPPATTPPTASGSASVSVSVKLSVSEMKVRSQTIIGQIQEDHRYVLALREKIRKKKDVIKLDCINDRLVQLKAQMNIADRANVSLEAALEKDTNAARDLFSQLEGTGNSVRELREQANQCIGEPELFKQEAGLDVDRPELPDDPGVMDPVAPEGAVVEPPGYASAFM